MRLLEMEHVPSHTIIITPQRGLAVNQPPTKNGTGRPQWGRLSLDNPIYRTNAGTYYSGTKKLENADFLAHMTMKTLNFGVSSRLGPAQR